MSADSINPVVPTGQLLTLRHDQVVPNPSNPRRLFDPAPLADLKANIKLHGVLVPITVYPKPGTDKFGILDGARRHLCCRQLADDGVEILIPANVVEPPDHLANLLYMFSIHNFREAWELMPTALSLQEVMEQLGEDETKVLSHLTGLSEPQVERCKALLKIDRKYQEMSLAIDPSARIPSNFWIELQPILDLAKVHLPELWADLKSNGITDLLVEKYRQKRIKSVIHFRRISEAFDIFADDNQKKDVAARLRQYITETGLETRRAFDQFIVDARRIDTAIGACDEFRKTLERAKIVHAIDADRTAVVEALSETKCYIEALLVQLEGSDAPVADAETLEGQE